VVVSTYYYFHLEWLSNNIPKSPLCLSLHFPFS
jgi:hypothetical protein